jgi:single-strand DNA-binding protein
MAGINKVILIGNLGAEPEVRTIESGRKVASLRLATTETYKNAQGERVEQTEWHSVVFWGAIAEVIEKYLHKGSQIYVEGRLRTRSYDDKDNIKRYVTEVVGQTMTMLGGKPGGSGESNNSGASNSYSKPAAATTSAAVPVGDEPDDLPF